MVGGVQRQEPLVFVRFQRWDRESDLVPSVAELDWERAVHHYGSEIDELLDQLVGGADRLDRASTLPAGELPDSDITVELHEGGPEFAFALEQLPAFVSAATGVFSAWVAWRSTKRKSHEAGFKREVRVDVGRHRYVGPVDNLEDLQAIVNMLAGLTERSGSGQRH